MKKCNGEEKKMNDEGEDVQGAGWSGGLLNPPAVPSVDERPNPFGVLTRPRMPHVFVSPSSHCVSAAHLLCIKVGGKGDVSVSRLACSSLKKGYHQKGAWGGNKYKAEDCVFNRSGGCDCTAGRYNTRGSESKPVQNKECQSTFSLRMSCSERSFEHKLDPGSAHRSAASRTPALT